VEIGYKDKKRSFGTYKDLDHAILVNKVAREKLLPTRHLKLSPFEIEENVKLAKAAVLELINVIGGGGKETTRRAHLEPAVATDLAHSKMEGCLQNLSTSGGNVQDLNQQIAKSTVTDSNVDDEPKKQDLVISDTNAQMATKSVTKWLCDHCRKELFDSYEEAFEHELHCVEAPHHKSCHLSNTSTHDSCQVSEFGSTHGAQLLPNLDNVTSSSATRTNSPTPMPCLERK